jgi:hypothetical protein
MAIVGQFACPCLARKRIPDCLRTDSSIPSVTFASRRRFEPVEDALEVDEEGGPMSLDLAEMVGDTQIDQRLMGAFDLALGSG